MHCVAPSTQHVLPVQIAFCLFAHPSNVPSVQIALVSMQHMVPVQMMFWRFAHPLNVPGTHWVTPCTQHSEPVHVVSERFAHPLNVPAVQIAPPEEPDELELDPEELPELDELLEPEPEPELDVDGSQDLEVWDHETGACSPVTVNWG